jgi:indolepyruvate ferredoxin oxidoreductase
MSDLSVGSSLRAVGLDDKYTATEGTVYLTGVQALVRLPMMQKRRDRAAGLNTGGYITGYRGSPLGTFDDQLVKARKHLQEHDVVFVPGVNEDLAATAVWGSQMAEIGGDGRFDGVFSIWYGKGPGVDRSGDAFRHGNLAGSSKNGGVLVLMGDDHTCESSTTCHQSEFALVDAQMPILSPAGVPELIEHGLYGWALSRYSGCWVGMKCIKDTADASGSVEVHEAGPSFTLPELPDMPPDGLNIRLPDTPHAQEYRLVNHKLDAVRAFARANRIDRVAFGRREGRRWPIWASTRRARRRWAWRSTRPAWCGRWSPRASPNSRWGWTRSSSSRKSARCWRRSSRTSSTAAPARRRSSARRMSAVPSCSAPNWRWTPR